MKIEEQIQGDIAVLKVTGAPMNGPDVGPFHDHVKKLSQDGIIKIVADFSRVK